MFEQTTEVRLKIYAAPRMMSIARTVQMPTWVVQQHQNSRVLAAFSLAGAATFVACYRGRKGPNSGDMEMALLTLTDVCIGCPLSEAKRPQCGSG